MTRKSVLIAGTAFALASLAAFAGATTAQDQGSGYSADTVLIENFIGRVEIVTGSSSQVSVAISNSGGLVEDPQVQQSGSTVAIDGGQSLRNLNCNTRDGQMRIGRRWGARHDIADYPLLTITAPASLALRLGDSAFQGTSGDLGSLGLEIDSCGDFQIGNVANDAEIRINGSGDVTTRDIGGELNLSINGSGDVVVGAIAGTAHLRINGSGDVRTGDVTGDTEVGINGSGDIEFDDIAGLDVRISGSGDVTAARMNGALNVRVGGSGDVRVRGGRAEPVDISINGSGDVSFGGTAVNVTVRESGSGDVHIEDIEGTLDWHRNGRSILRIGDGD